VNGAAAGRRSMLCSSPTGTARTGSLRRWCAAWPRMLASVEAYPMVGAGVPPMPMCAPSSGRAPSLASEGWSADGQGLAGGATSPAAGSRTVPPALSFLGKVRGRITTGSWWWATWSGSSPAYRGGAIAKPVLYVDVYKTGSARASIPAPKRWVDQARLRASSICRAESLAGLAARTLALPPPLRRQRDDGHHPLWRITTPPARRERKSAGRNAAAGQPQA
jgi:hypothetical protein